MLLSLYSDILFLIGDLLPIDSLVSLSSTCKDLRKILNPLIVPLKFLHLNITKDEKGIIDQEYIDEEGLTTILIENLAEDYYNIIFEINIPAKYTWRREAILLWQEEYWTVDPNNPEYDYLYLDGIAIKVEGKYYEFHYNGDFHEGKAGGEFRLAKVPITDEAFNKQVKLIAS